LARAQVFRVGLLPDPVLSGSYNVLIGGPAFANAIGATLTADVAALIALPARRRAARAAADQTDGAVVWRKALLHVWTSGNRGQRREATIVPRSER